MNKKINKCLLGVAVGIMFITSNITTYANEWTKVNKSNSTTTTNQETSKYYFLGLTSHITWRNTAGSWDKGKPGTNYSDSYTLNNVKSIAQNIPGMKGKLDNIKNVTLSPPLANISFYKDSLTNDNFAYSPMYKNAVSSDSKAFDVLLDVSDKYTLVLHYPQSSVKFSNIKYNKDTDKLSYNIAYPLKSVVDEYGYRLDRLLRQDLVNNVSQTQAKENEFNRYLQYIATADKLSVAGPDPASSAPTSGFNPIILNPSVQSSMYFTPTMYTFEVENSDPIITWERIDESEKPVCVQGKSGGIQFTVKNVKKEWLKLEGYLEFTDAEGKIPDWKVTHKVQYDEKSMFATRTNCIDYVPEKLKACYILDPSKPNEFNSYLRV